MANSNYGAGTLFKRGDIWYISYWVDGRQVQKSTRSTELQDAKRLRDQILAGNHAENSTTLACAGVYD